MTKQIIFIFVLFFIAGCGMSGSKSEDDSKDISLDSSATTNDLNTSSVGTQIATTNTDNDAILPQVFSIAFPSILKKDSIREETTVNNSSTPVDENIEIADSNETTVTTQESESNNTMQSSPQSESNNTIESNQEESESNNTAQTTQESDNNSSEMNTSIVDSNSTLEDNETIQYCEASDNNETVESNQTEDNKNNIAYNDLIEKVGKIERVITISQLNLTVLEGAMVEILNSCSDIDFNTSCDFEEGSLLVIMDSSTISRLSLIVKDNNITFPDINDTTFYLGETSYIKYSEDSPYQYGLTHHMSSKKMETDINNSKIEQYIFKWSENSSDTMTQYRYEDNETESKVSIHYLLGEDDKELMHVAFVKDSNLSGKKETINLTLVKKGDENGSFSITSDSIEEFIDGNETNISKFSSNGDISDDSSLLLFSGQVSHEDNSTETQRTTVLDDNRVRCDTKEPEITLYDLNITGGNLEDGEYLIFSQDTVLTELSSLEVYEHSIGSFTVNGDKIQGGLRGDSYEDILDSLIIIELLESQESTYMFRVIEEDKKPNLEIIKY